MRSHPQDLTVLFDTIEYPEAFRITYLANAIVFPAYGAVHRDFGLTRPEYILLACLSHFEELTAQEIARITRRPRNTISRAVNRMLRESYIARSPDPNDGRQARLKITRSGRALHEKIARYLVLRQDEVLSVLNKTERKTLASLLRKVARHASELDD